MNNCSLFAKSYAKRGLGDAVMSPQSQAATKQDLVSETSESLWEFLSTPLLQNKRYARSPNVLFVLTLLSFFYQVHAGCFITPDQSGHVLIPATVTSIDRNAFDGCSSLRSVTFESGSQLTSIGYAAFRESGLTSIIIPASVTSISDKYEQSYAFQFCRSLRSVTFESGSQLASIGDYAFQYTGLTSIIIPASVTSIDNRAFTGCESLSSVIFESGSQLASIGIYASAQIGVQAA